MSLYQPTCTLSNTQGNQWNVRTVVGVANGEELRLASNSVSGDTRTIVYDVITGGSGGTITEIESVVRQAGEDYVTVKIDKDKKTEGSSTNDYD
ncbi:MAG: hypothetical protein KDC12_10390 [Flavobacteriales bacterium]|nr:hypothetical protein [Flavobacteriales bacterium]